jgi:large subunit ribosomal protein L22
MRLVIDTIRGKDVNEAYALLKFSKKHAAQQIEKVLRSAVANAEQDAIRNNEAFDVDQLVVDYAVVNEGTTLWRFRAAAMGRAAPILRKPIPTGSGSASSSRGAPAGTLGASSRLCSKRTS